MKRSRHCIVRHVPSGKYVKYHIHCDADVCVVLAYFVESIQEASYQRIDMKYLIKALNVPAEELELQRIEVSMGVKVLI